MITKITPILIFLEALLGFHKFSNQRVEHTISIFSVPTIANIRQCDLLADEEEDQ